jgi:hypothetical protein
MKHQTMFAATINRDSTIFTRTPAALMDIFRLEAAAWHERIYVLITLRFIIPCTARSETINILF